MKAKALIALLSIFLIGISFTAFAQSCQNSYITKCPLVKDAESGSNSQIIQTSVLQKQKWNCPLQFPFLWKWSSRSRYNHFVENVVIVETASGYGTGTIIGDHILTCAHVVEEQSTSVTIDSSGNLLIGPTLITVDSIVKIIFSDGLSIDGYVIKSDHKKDLAEISIASHPPCRSIKIGRCPKVGDKLFEIGHPQGMFYSYSEGKVMYPRRNLDGVEMIQMDLTSYFGSSGSPIFNSKGELVGVTDAIIKGTSITFAISADEIKEFLIE